MAILENAISRYFAKGEVPGPLGMRHPYFSPRGFWVAAGGLEVRRYFGCQTFKGSNIFWFEGYLGARLDSEGAGYGLARAQLVRDFIDRLTLASHLDVIQSSVYDLVEVGLDLTWRF